MLGPPPHPREAGGCTHDPSSCTSLLGTGQENGGGLRPVSPDSPPWEAGSLRQARMATYLAPLRAS